MSARREKVPPIHVRYKTAQQASYVKAKASEAGLSVNSYICAATLDHHYVRPHNSEILGELRQAKRQLIGIGINLNQLMHKVNEGNGHIDPIFEYIDIIRVPVLEALKIIRKALSTSTNRPLP